MAYNRTALPLAAPQPRPLFVPSDDVEVLADQATFTTEAHRRMGMALKTTQQPR